MPTQKQIEANRRNAQKSTGPVTLEGKAVCAMNAFKTGLYAASLIIPGEKLEDLEELIPVSEPGGLVHRAFLRDPDETSDPGVGDRHRWGRHRVEGLIDAGGSLICGRSHAHG